MKKVSILNKFVLILFLFSTFFISTITSTPIYNRYEQFAIYNVFGTDKFYERRDKFEMAIQLSPFYQHASGARDEDGKKVPEGDMFGQWSMFGLFHGKVPTEADFSQMYPRLSKAERMIKNIPNYIKPLPDSSKYKRDIIAENNEVGFYTVGIDYEKLGTRGVLEFRFKCGFGLTVKSGVITYKQYPLFGLNSALTADLSSTDTVEKQAAQIVDDYLMTDSSRQVIGDELGINLENVRDTTFEDTHVQIDWSIPFDLKNEEDEHVVTMVPYVAVGCWIPTGKKKKTDIAFSLPTGNDGHFGVTLEGSINFDFPGMVQLGFGAGAAFYESKTLNNYRVPSHEFQNGIYPWKTNIKRDPGAVWYANASFKAPDFIENLSFFFDYIYKQHNKDEITLREDDARASKFKPTKLEEESKWKSNIVHAGLNYKVTPGLQLGISFNSHISGVRVYRTTTILGTMSFIF